MRAMAGIAAWCAGGVCERGRIECGSRNVCGRYRGAYGVVVSGIAAGRERYIGGAVLRYDLIALSLDQE